MHVIIDLSTVTWLISLLCSLYAAYYLLISLFSFRKPNPFPETNTYRRFLVLIAARNEAAVIGHLIDSLQQQKYPKDRFDICVVPNNCTDRTREISLDRAALVYDCAQPVSSKGDALNQAVADLMLQDRTYDALCVFDADNLVHPDFLAAMNRALSQGHSAAQGYRDSKNPADTSISGSYAIYYWMISRFYNLPRRNLGLSASISGSGFMLSRELLARLGGWNTHTLTEDLEMTTQIVLAGAKVTYVPEAIIYDEQPLTFTQSWHQRLRWSTGIWQIGESYLGKLMRLASRQKSLIAFDQALFYLAPAMQLVYALSFFLNVALQMLMIHFELFPERHVYKLMFLSLDFSYLMTTFLAGFTILLERKQKSVLLKSVLFYWIFLSSWFVINVRSLIKRTVIWTPIAHTRSMVIDDVMMNR